MNKTTFKYLILLTILASTSSYSEPATDINEWGDEKLPLVLDLAHHKKITFDASGREEIYIMIKNMLPKRRDVYDIQFGSQTLSPAPFTDPRVSDETPTQQKQKQEALTDSCTAIFAEINTSINNLQKESELPEYIEKINAFIKNKSCTEHHEVAKKLKDETRQTFKVSIQSNTEYTIKVSHKESEIATLTITEPPTEWLTHVGMTFINNKDEFYFSEQKTSQIEDPDTGEVTEETSYTIAKGADRGGMGYAATAIFTYPLIKRISHSDIDFGISVGLGADKDNISALVGLSVVVNKNFVLTLGAIATEFDVLKSQYKVGQSVGETALDSTSLTKQTYKFSPMLTLAYKFGS